MADSLTAAQIIGIVLGAALSILLMPNIVKFAAQAVPFLVDVVSDIFKEWLEAWREAVAELKKLFKGAEQ